VSKRSLFHKFGFDWGLQPARPPTPFAFTPDAERCVGVLTKYHKITNLLRFRVNGHQSSTTYI